MTSSSSNQTSTAISTSSLSGHLIIVCCHAIWMGGPEKGYDEAEWLLVPFHLGETGCFIEHMKVGLRILAKSDNGLLVFSGGPTRSETPLSEAESYLNLATANNFWNILPPTDSPNPKNSVVIEPHSLDSYQNLLFSLLTYHNTRKCWPEKISIVSHQFKGRRFVDLHCRALGLVEGCGSGYKGKVEFVGVEPEYMRMGDPAFDEEKTRVVVEGERERGFEAWVGDLYGKGDFLTGKRKSRNHWGVDAEEVINTVTDEHVRPLWEWNGEGLYTGRMPWGIDEC